MITNPTRLPLDDDAIDRIAAAMTAADPAPDFRVRLSARLDAADRPAGRWRGLVMAAALAAIALAAWTTWPRDTRLPAPGAAAGPAIAASTPARVVNSVARVDPNPIAPASASRATRDTAARPAFVPAVEMVPLLDAPDAIVKEPIQPAALSIPQLTVDTIVMPAVDSGGSLR